MKKKVLLIIFTVLLLCSCKFEKGEKSISVSELEQETVQNDLEVTETEAETTEEPVTTALKEQNHSSFGGEISYHAYSDVVSADDIYDVEMVELPPSINGIMYYVCGLIDGKIMVCLNKEETAETFVCEYGLYDYKTDSYEILIPYITNGFYLGAYKNCHFFNISENEDSESLQLYNSDTDEYVTVFNNVNGCSFKSYEIAICDGKCYFDVYTSPEKDNSKVYEYDIENNKLSTYAEYAMLPKASGNNLWYVSYNHDTKICDKLVNKSSGTDFDIQNKNILTPICFSNRVFAVTNDDISSPKTSDVLKEIHADGDDTLILATWPGEGEIISNVTTNDFCIGWFDITGNDSTPCVYDVENEKIAVFGDMPKCYYRTYLDDKSGLLFDEMNFSSTHQVWVFEPKEK